MKDVEVQNRMIWTTDNLWHMIPAILLLVLLTGGCINITTRLQPEDTSVKEVLQGSDCVDTFLGFGSGTITVEQAKRNTRPFGQERFGYGVTRKPADPITKVRRVELTDFGTIFGATRCIEVVGE